MNVAKQWAINFNEIETYKRKLGFIKSNHKHLGILLKNGCEHSGGRKDDVCGESGINYWVFPSSMNDNQINQALINMGILEDTDRGIFDDNDWDCSGQTLTDKPYISKRTKTRVLVTQTWSIDI